MPQGLRGTERLEADREPIAVGTIDRSNWLQDARAVEMLDAVLEHRSVDLVQQPIVDVHDAVRVDAEKVAVVREVMDGAESEAVDHGGTTERVAVFDDVRGLQQRSLLQRADRAARSIRLQDGPLKPVLM